jgi:hypothetical protein
VYLLERILEQSADFLFGVKLDFGDNGQSGLFPVTTFRTGEVAKENKSFRR